MSEKALANKMKIEILDHVSKQDLPGFLFEQIDSHLEELNYFKISNLLNNIDAYVAYLHKVAHNYHQYVIDHNPATPTQALSESCYEPFMTNALYAEEQVLNFTPRELIKLSSLYSVSCLITMKEYINRRILQKKTTKAFAKK